MVSIAWLCAASPLEAISRSTSLQASSMIAL
jgi:hypothetical protein